MSISPQDPSSDTIHLLDVLSLINKRKYWIVFFALGGAFLFFAFGLTRPIFFHSEATFKEKGNSGQMLPFKSFDQIFAASSSSSFQNEAKSLFTSRKLLTRLSDQLGLQASISSASSSSGTFQRVKENLSIEYSYFKHLKSYPIPDPALPIKISEISYSQPFPLSLNLEFDDEGFFQVIDCDSGEKMGTGMIGSVFETKEVRFRVDRDQEFNAPESFVLTLHPIETIVKTMRQRLKIAPDKDDGSLITLQFVDQDRKRAASVLNTLMDIYQSYLREEQERISFEQIDYLDRRKKEMREHLQKTLYAYAAEQSSDINDLGFVVPKEGMRYITEQLQLLSQKQMERDFTLQRLQKLDGKRCFYQTCDYPQLFNEFIGRIQQLDAQIDQVEMGLRTHSSKNLSRWKEGFSQQIKDLNEVRICMEDAKILRTSLESEAYPLPSVQLMAHPQYMVSFWNDELKLCLQKLEDAHPWEKDSYKEEYHNFRRQFMEYLNNLVHHLEVYQSLVKDRLEHQQAPSSEFQGINLDTALELYVSYHRQLNEIENQMIQNRFMIDQLDDPEFELSSFSALGHHDPIITDLMQKASEYVVAIQDDSNRGSKEKQRMKSELDTMQKFYALHLKQSLSLAEIKILQIKEKIESLQNSVLNLIQQQRSILENQFLEAVKSQTEKLEQEKVIISDQMDILRNELRKIPHKWAEQQLVEHQIKTSASIVEELSALVESKNISRNILTLQSSPLDQALTPAKPLRPKLFLYTTIGSLFGAFFGTALALFFGVMEGVPISRRYLELKGLNIVPFKDSSLSLTSSKMISCILKKQIHQFALIGETLTDLSLMIASQLGKGESQAILIEIGEKKQLDPSEMFDHAFFESQSLDILSLSQSLKEYRESYDFVVLYAASPPHSLLAGLILDQCEAAFVSVSWETSLEVKSLLERANKQDIWFLL